MPKQPFKTLLLNLLIKYGHSEGRDSWADEIGVGSRTLSRWLNEDVLPSKGNWTPFVEAIRREQCDSSEVKSDLQQLEQARGQALRQRRANQTQRDQLPIESKRVSIRDASALHDSPHDGVNRLYSRFLADTRIAAQLTTTSGVRSIYLEDVYVHRAKIEKAVLIAADKYLASDEENRGRWLSIAGDAGHGKTSLLWWLAQVLHRRCPQVFPVQALQLSLESFDEFVHSLPTSGEQFIVILDTLDLVTGIDDAVLAALLNDVRAKGGLLVTSCRRQELQLFARHIRSDQTIDLGRYEPDEAHTAIERYVKASYRGWPKGKKDAQVDHVWELLDERRRIQDLNFEPLLLRMIFEAYVPDDIPPDINTQKVYDHFWQERVLGDRQSKTPEVARARDNLSRMLASYLYFNEAVHTERGSVDSFLSHCETQGVDNALATLDGLVSSGVIRYWQMKSACGFFHQTFLEYVAARDLLALNDKHLQRRRIDQLFVDTERANLFRVPVLKQLLIQASASDRQLFDELCTSVAEIGTPVAARLTLEVLGKAEDVSRLHGMVLEWSAREPGMFQAVAPEVLRNFSAARVGIACNILEHNISKRIVGEICYICETFFAPMEPNRTLAFLRDLWRSDVNLFSECEGNLKSAIVAVFRAGDSSALEALAEMLPTLSVGVQVGAFDNLSEAWTLDNASAAAGFLGRMFEYLSTSSANGPRIAYTNAFRALHRIDSSETVALIGALRARVEEPYSLRAATFMGPLIGIASPSSLAIRDAIGDLLGSDHVRRLGASGLLHEAATTRNKVIDDLLGLPSNKSLSADALAAIYFVTSGSRDPQRMLDVIDRWSPVEHGAGDAYRDLMESIVKVDPGRILLWLKAQRAKAKSGPRQRQILVGFQILAANAAAIIPSVDARQFFEWGFLRAGATDEMRRVFANAAGWITEIDGELAQEIFLRVYETRRKEFINASIHSLSAVTSTDFICFVFDLTYRFTQREPTNATFGHFLGLMARRNSEVREALLQRLATPEAKTLIASLNAPVVVSHLLTLLKSTVRANLAMSLELANICPILDEGNAATLSSVLENASHQTTDPELTRKILQRLLEVSSIPSYRIRNSLHRALPHIDKALPHREAVGYVLKTIKAGRGWDEKSLEHLVRAAKRMDSWDRADSEALLRSDLAHSVKAVLLS